MNLIMISFGTQSGSTSLWATIFTGLSVALGGGVVLFGLNWLREHIVASWNRQSEAGVLAFSLTTQLDAFISGCFEVVTNGWEEDPKTGMPESTAKSPTLAFSDDLQWRVFPKQLQYEIRSLPNELDVADRILDSTWEFGDPWDVYYEREVRYSELGLKALAINEKLARLYEVPLLARGSWDPKKRFEDRLERERKKNAAAGSNPLDLSWMLPGPSLAELETRRIKLGVALEAAQARRANRR